VQGLTVMLTVFKALQPVTVLVVLIV
jgi:hypothetical protein